MLTPVMSLHILGDASFCSRPPKIVFTAHERQQSAGLSKSIQANLVFKLLTIGIDGMILGANVIFRNLFMISI